MEPAAMAEMSLAQKELVAFITSLDKDAFSFLKKFVEAGVCYRCILMLFRESNLSLYRITDFSLPHDSSLLNEEVGPFKETLCTIC